MDFAQVERNHKNALKTLKLKSVRDGWLSIDEVGQIQYEAMCGSSINHVCAEMCSISKETARTVLSNFNGQLLRAIPVTDPLQLEFDWRLAMDKAAAEYRSSPQGQKAEAEQKMVALLSQRKTDELIAKLPTVLNDLPALVAWLSELSNCADHVDVKWDNRAVSVALLSAGYKPNEHIGRPKKAYDDYRTMGRYIVGQALKNIKDGMAPHPVIQRFADQYKQLFNAA